MLPWNIEANNKVDERRVFDLYQRSEAHEFCFAVLAASKDEDEYNTMVFICPIEYWDRVGKMFPETMPIAHLVPKYLVEIFDATFDTVWAHTFVMNDLIRRGFIHNSKFQKFVSDYAAYDPMSFPE